MFQLKENRNGNSKLTHKLGLVASSIGNLDFKMQLIWTIYRRNLVPSIVVVRYVSFIYNSII